MALSKENHGSQTARTSELRDAPEAGDRASGRSSLVERLLTAEDEPLRFRHNWNCERGLNAPSSWVTRSGFLAIASSVSRTAMALVSRRVGTHSRVTQFALDLPRRPGPAWPGHNDTHLNDGLRHLLYGRRPGPLWLVIPPLVLRCPLLPGDLGSHPSAVPLSTSMLFLLEIRSLPGSQPPSLLATPAPLVTPSPLP